MWKDPKVVLPIWNELFPLGGMADYLAGCPLEEGPFLMDPACCGDDPVQAQQPPERPPIYRYQLAHAVAGAPIPLARKQALLARLAEEEQDGFFASLVERVGRALEQLQARPGETFTLTCYCERAASPFPSEPVPETFPCWELLLDRVREVLGHLEPEEREWTWFQAEKWAPDRAGHPECRYDYTLLGTEPCYFDQKDPAAAQEEPCGDAAASAGDAEEGAGPSRLELPFRVLWPRFDLYQDPNLPVPFRAGDLLTVDGRPFAPVSRLLLLEVGDNRDCCCLQALFRESDGSWRTGAVKHGYVFAGRATPGFSPLYRLAPFEGQLPEEERLLERVRRQLGGDEARGAALDNALFDLCCTKRKRTVSGQELAALLEECFGRAGSSRSQRRTPAAPAHRLRAGRAMMPRRLRGRTFRAAGRARRKGAYTR